MVLSRQWIIIVFLLSCQLPVSHPEQGRASMSNDIMQSLLSISLDPWYPRAIDLEYGGFYSDFDKRWDLDGEQNKMIVTQARHVWTASTAAEFLGDSSLLAVAKHGVGFLRDKMWDTESGGFYQQVDRYGNPIGKDETHGYIKTAYGNAFAIYGLSAYSRVSRDGACLELAKLTFGWLESHSHDPHHGGYFQDIGLDGSPLKMGHSNPPKDQNSSIHLLEAFTELYRVWPDSLVKERLTELVTIIRDTITCDDGYLRLFFDQAWTPISYRDSTSDVREAHYNHDHVSFGHDIETAYLLMEATEILGNRRDKITFDKARRMVDHSIRMGWDFEVGGLYDEGYYFGDSMSIIKDTKVWWAQMEAMNTLLIMSDLYPEDPINYLELFSDQWSYIQDNLIDSVHTGVYWGGLDKSPNAVSGPKATIWKGNYHTVRSFMNCIRRLKADEEARRQVLIHKE